jgi:NAD(P)-dependent dehydrogenase (short-subunit alcohol dehydrogenase family)
MAAQAEPKLTGGEPAGRSVIVTGAARGIGACIAERLAQAGYAVVATDVLGDELEQRARSLRAEGLRCVATPCDVSNELDVTRAVELARAAADALWGVVNCAALSGVVVKQPTLEQSAEAWRRIVDVNLTGVFLVSQAAARVMAEGGGGVIVNISSVSGIGAEEDAAAYCATKAGVLGLTRAMALDLASLGIRVCAIAPGDIATERSLEVAAATESRFPKRTPAGTGEPADVAAAVAFLLSDEARFVSGSALVVDGGLMAY